MKLSACSATKPMGMAGSGALAYTWLRGVASSDFFNTPEVRSVKQAINRHRPMGSGGSTG